MGVGAGLYMYDVVVKKFTFAISSPDEFSFDPVQRNPTHLITKEKYFDQRPNPTHHQIQLTVRLQAQL